MRGPVDMFGKNDLASFPGTARFAGAPHRTISCCNLLSAARHSCVSLDTQARANAELARIDNRPPLDAKNDRRGPGYDSRAVTMSGPEWPRVRGAVWAA